jgi:hypothetical protein
VLLQPKSGGAVDVFLDGEELELLSVEVDGRPLKPDTDYKVRCASRKLRSSFICTVIGQDVCSARGRSRYTYFPLSHTRYGVCCAIEELV